MSDRTLLFTFMEERFGIPRSTFEAYLLFKRKKHWVILGKTSRISCVSAYKISKAGMIAFRRVGAFVKPTTRFIQCFGHKATMAVFEVDLEGLSRLISGDTLSVDLDLETGYMILSLEGVGVLGLGFYKEGRIRSQLPKKGLNRTVIEEIW